MVADRTAEDVASCSRHVRVDHVLVASSCIRLTSVVTSGRMLLRKKPKQLQLAIGDDGDAGGDVGRFNRWAIVVIGGALATVAGTTVIGLTKPNSHPRTLSGTLVLRQALSVWLLGANGEGAPVAIAPSPRILEHPIVDFHTSYVKKASSPPQGFYYSSSNSAFIAATDIEAAVTERSFQVDSRLSLYSVSGKPGRLLRSSRQFSFSAPIVSPDGRSIAYEKTII